MIEEEAVAKDSTKAKEEEMVVGVVAKAQLMAKVEGLHDLLYIP